MMMIAFGVVCLVFFVSLFAPDLFIAPAAVAQRILSCTF
jgi:hypothetical protein